MERHLLMIASECNGLFWLRQYEFFDIEDDEFESEDDARQYASDEADRKRYPHEDVDFEMVRFIEFTYDENDDMQIISRSKWENENELFG